MTNVGEIYVCRICGNAVEVIVAGSGRLVCCGKSMEIVEEWHIKKLIIIFFRTFLVFWIYSVLLFVITSI